MTEETMAKRKQVDKWKQDWASDPWCDLVELYGAVQYADALIRELNED